MMTEPAKRGITIRDCLTNTTGLVNPSTMPHFYRQQYGDVLTTLGWIGRDANMLSMPDGESPPTNRERVRAQAELPLAAHPGEQFGYHLGYRLLSAVLEEASGQRLDELFQEAILDPLDMNDTAFYLKDGSLDRFGASYVPREVDGEMRLVAVDRAATSEKTVGPKVEFRRRRRHGRRSLDGRRLRPLRPDALERRRTRRRSRPRPQDRRSDDRQPHGRHGDPP